ncbi:putative non-specific serine/threonine protein kinase [Dioscorea sansibarensis]
MGLSHFLHLSLHEYIQDGIDWTNLSFADNTDCLSLFEKKPLGLLSLLDEESKVPQATALTLANKLKLHLTTNPCFKEESEGAFTVCHCAGQVSYDTTGFLEKNRDPLCLDSIQLLLSCSCQLPKLFASRTLNKSQNPVGNQSQVNNVNPQSPSVGTKFKVNLSVNLNKVQHSKHFNIHFFCFVLHS